MALNACVMAEKILIVDDLAVNIQIIISIFEMHELDYEFYQATNGVLAFEITKKVIPDLIISDWDMPVLSGIELIALLKKEESTKNIPIIICTGKMTSSDNLQIAFDTGAADFIRKPIDEVELISRVKNHLELKIQRTKIEDYSQKLESEISERKKIEAKFVKVNKELFELNTDLEMRVISEFRKIEKQQKLLIQKSKLESLGILAAGMAHEINQPLTSISMGLENILLKNSLDKLSSNYLVNKLKSLFEDIERIKRLIQHVRQFSRNQNIEMFDKVDIKQVISDALMLMKAQLHDLNIEIAVSESESEVKTLGNRNKLEQVIINMLSNSRDAIIKKEPLVSNLQFTKKINISLSVSETVARIEVTDNGVGIDAESSKKIFDPFYTSKSEKAGTGLGLSISYGIVKDMKGEIFVESEEMKYTKMIIELPKI